MKVYWQVAFISTTAFLAGCSGPDPSLVIPSSQAVPALSSESLSTNADELPSQLSPSLLRNYQQIEYKTSETLTRDDLLLLLASGYQELAAAYCLQPPAEIAGSGSKFSTQSPVPPYFILYYDNGIQNEKTGCPDYDPKCLWTNQEIFGVKPGEPLENFWKYFGQKPVRYGFFESDQFESYFLYYINNGIRYTISSGNIQEPVYTTLCIDPVQDLRRYDTTDPYLNLVGRDTAELTLDDYRLLLTTSSGKLVEKYDLPLRHTEQSLSEEDIDEFYRFDNNAQLPVYNMTVHFSGLEDTEVPNALEVYGPCAELLGIPMGSSFDQLEKEWGPGESYFYGDPYGYIGKRWRGIRYEKEGLIFEFECSWGIWWENYYEDTLAGINEPPQELWPLYLDRVYIRLSY